MMIRTVSLLLRMAVVVLLAGSTFGGDLSAEPDHAGRAGSHPDSDLAVSMVQVLVNPEPLIGRRIQVTGYLRDAVQLELYLTQDHAMIPDPLSALPIEVDQGSESMRKCADAYAVVLGRFDRTHNGRLAIVTADRIARSSLMGLEPCWARVRSAPR